ATLVVARWENQLDRDALKRALDGHPQPLAAQPDLKAGPGDDAVITAD
ncbi:MAG: C4-dicarboxylate transporter DctA, partial [Caulobacteraceae bacterium]|nr:C4-dicarboxylate transporter DctA [Caulobacteraceae bacterium]